MAPIGTTQRQLLEALTPFVPAGGSILVVLVVPGDVGGRDIHVAHTGDEDGLRLAATDWVVDTHNAAHPDRRLEPAVPAPSPMVLAWIDRQHGRTRGLEDEQGHALRTAMPHRLERAVRATSQGHGFPWQVLEDAEPRMRDAQLHAVNAVLCAAYPTEATATSAGT